MNTPVAPTGAAALPRWLPWVNRVMRGVHAAGLPVGPVNVISVPGRRTGRMQTTPVTPFEVDGARYVAALADAQWVRNAREAGWAVLGRGHDRYGVRLEELPLERRQDVLRHFPVLVPRGVGFFVRTGTVSAPAGPDQFAAAAAAIAVFGIQRLGTRP